MEDSNNEIKLKKIQRLKKWYATAFAGMHGFSDKTQKKVLALIAPTFATEEIYSNYIIWGIINHDNFHIDSILNETHSTKNEIKKLLLKKISNLDSKVKKQVKKWIDDFL